LGWTTKPPYRTFYSKANLAARPEQKCGRLPFLLARTKHFRGEGWCSTWEPKNPGGYGYTPSNIFTNNNKSHKKGEVCNCMIREKSATYYWKHECTQDNVPEPKTSKHTDEDFI
jgi:hypothetical protein